MVHIEGPVLSPATGASLPAVILPPGWVKSYPEISLSRRCFFFLLPLLMLPGAPPFLSAQPSRFDDLKPYLEQRLPQWLERYRVPGASIAVIREARPHWIAAFGMADAGRQQPLTPQTVFQAASITKSLTAWGVMKLAGEGRIELDVPVDRYLSRWRLPESRFGDREVTVRRLLSHTAGLPNPTYPANFDPPARPSPEALLSGAIDGRPPLELMSAPGSAFHYSNAGYTLLQLVLSEVSGRSFTDYMYGAVLAPLGMRHSNFKWEEVPPEKRAAPHDFQGRTAPSQFVAQLGATGLNTTASDLANFVSAGMPSLRAAVRGYPVLPPEVIEQMQEPLVEIRGAAYLGAESYGLGYFVETSSRGYKVVSHSGYNPPGWNAYFFAVPNTGDGLVVLTNGENGRLVINDIAHAWARATGIGNLALTSTYRKISAAIWLTTALAIVLAFALGRSFLTALRLGQRGLSRKNAFARLLGVLVLATGISITWTSLHLFLLAWTPRTAQGSVWALTAALAAAILPLLFPKKEVARPVRENPAPANENAPEKP